MVCPTKVLEEKAKRTQVARRLIFHPIVMESRYIKIRKRVGKRIIRWCSQTMGVIKNILKRTMLSSYHRFSMAFSIDFRHEKRIIKPNKIAVPKNKML
ncbi:MAG: hypothetical protein A2Z91_09555 [Deltaproteobacteria bacterium GWA2_38_16]|nr:MAG: hypothetical protein A2Z91_09555 [Deltaproteobacteria bacterium GWA2_38_16]OGQ02462.1 MAG: hypothetical protein A3D19_09175 [Deltaproteobacteria bacterium RIFCSPHIGHO2_02_FULL_38_15]OGQ33852.1 MAG: hypothetical protein A3A72_06515 [Deltaproteobacteria bacterium RIFCSPLOWO2_01_FULL_38_9]OGQ62177.1 MAG: hypothetical protein A3G92_07695 [Deltaproteobacteria bacterium RIFCSPLOWO2_12_FULL_38_8]